MDKTELYNIDRKILKSAGFYGGSNRDLFAKENPEAVKLYAKTYELTEDKELQTQFLSKNTKVVAAMMLASQKLVDNHSSFTKIPTDAVRKAAIDAKLKEYYEESLKEIDAGYIDASNPEEFSKIDANANIQKAKAENESIIEKQEKARPKVNSFSLKVACGKTKTCELKKFRIDSAPKKDKEAGIPSFDLFSNKKGVIQNLINAQMDAEDTNNIVDIFNSTKGLEVIHLVGGKLNFFQQNIKVVAKGTCEHGKAATTCPQVRIRSTGATIDKTGSRDLWLNNTDEQLFNVRLFPHDNASIEPEKSIQGMLSLLRDHSGKY